MAPNGAVVGAANITTGGDPRNIAIGADGTVVIANQDGWFDVVR